MITFFRKYKKSIFCILFDRLKTVLSTNIEKNNVNEGQLENENATQQQQSGSSVGRRSSAAEGQVPSDEQTYI